MRYTIVHYARALANAVEGASSRDIKFIAQNVVRLLRKKKSVSKLPRILSKARQLYFYKKNITAIDVISAAPLLPATREELRRMAGAGARINEMVRPEAMAGIKIIVNDAYCIDATAAGIMQKLFVTHE